MPSRPPRSVTIGTPGVPPIDRNVGDVAVNTGGPVPTEATAGEVVAW
ncbi:hypothetical protein [Myceligenerans pegani]|uniref:Uncharacterized protein n=1 Tax=Myceligenerans pegani TaxID=2776917 RepID=A0ABR9MTU4_9MICO|nr:hypothetical protein [Myceligenerans sp. TRM 65318]MBE1874789.1 hypothetical protein [Myceligenerans sp. TRM 65318]MBE3017060.1 hypothetical protein [Myceligenerans sp. TRM 65318]